ncbi:MAG: LysR family transcriptional regulator [Pseudomonadota bacterium]
MSASPESDTVPASADRIDLMRNFVRVVEAGSLSAAATQMGSTQPTVSRRLQALERMLGVTLLSRSTRGIRFTEDGAQCFEQAKEVIASWNAFQANSRGARDKPEGILRVLVPRAFGQELLVRPLTEYLRAYPDVSVVWLLDDRRPDYIAEGIDCAIQVGDMIEPDVVAIKLSEVPQIVVAAPSLLAGTKLPAHASELASLPWLALRTVYQTEVLLTHGPTGTTCNVQMRPRMSTDNLYALRSAAIMGAGVTVASAWVFKEDLEQGRLVQVLPEWHAATIPVHLVYPHARFYPAKLRRFIEAVKPIWTP